jgi:prolipoprotein diacylglyceryltransferase
MAGEAAAATAIGGVFFVMIFIWLIAMAVGVFSLIVWILMIVDVAKRDFKKEGDQIMWILIIVLTGIIGALIYYFIVKKPDKH